MFWLNFCLLQLTTLNQRFQETIFSSPESFLSHLFPVQTEVGQNLQFWHTVLKPTVHMEEMFLLSSFLLFSLLLLCFSCDKKTLFFALNSVWCFALSLECFGKNKKQSSEVWESFTVKYYENVEEHEVGPFTLVSLSFSMCPVGGSWYLSIGKVWWLIELRM